MNRTNIEWTDYTWNPCTGCSRGCEYCYAKAMAYRLRGRYGYPKEDPFKPTFHPDRLNEPKQVKKPSKIFTCSMGELFAQNYVVCGAVFRVMMECPQHTFQLLTKMPNELSYRTFSDNCWVGVSVDGKWAKTVDGLIECDAPVKFISFEPLLAPVKISLRDIDWVIVGGKTGRKPFVPPQSWVQPIIDEARRRDIPVFLKNNLHWPDEMQEYPRSMK